MDVLVLTEQELRRGIAIDMPAINVVAKGFEHLSKGNAVMPPIMHINVAEHDGDVDIKSAYIKGLDRFAVKIGAGFFKNNQLGLPSSPAMMVVLCAKTGMTEAILLDNAYLTDVRTAAAGAVAAMYLAPEKVTCAGVVGAGAQGRYQMMALKQVRDFKKLMVFDLNPDLVTGYVKEMAAILNVEVIAAKSVEDLVAQSQCVVTCTPARKAFILSDHLHPGLHITAMGADLPEKQEIEAAVFEKADIIACDTRPQSFCVGELFNARANGVSIGQSRVSELGEIISRKRAGRTTEDQITICDLSGTGVQDTMIANLALTKARDLNLGCCIPMT